MKIASDSPLLALLTLTDYHIQQSFDFLSQKLQICRDQLTFSNIPVVEEEWTVVGEY
jgi:hypothetical protein